MNKERKQIDTRPRKHLNDPNCPYCHFLRQGIYITRKIGDLVGEIHESNHFILEESN